MEREILSKAIIQLNKICKKIADRYVLKNINLDIYNEDITVITGHNGAGKSTLLKLLARLSRATSGTITYQDENLIKKSGFIFQKPIFLNRSVRGNLLHALSCAGNGLQWVRIDGEGYAVTSRILLSHPATQIQASCVFSNGGPSQYPLLFKKQANPDQAHANIKL